MRKNHIRRFFFDEIKSKELSYMEKYRVFINTEEIKVWGLKKKIKKV